jgi:UDP-N-acetylmuramate: L-alanyl-gamma-D-glutamyl-meso-diaminopimelate ligase
MHYLSLPEWMKNHVLRARRSIVIAGTHGKTTTTALTAYLLEAAGLSPGFLIGGQPLDFPNSARLGAPGVPFVIEGDEYDTAFFDKRAKFFHYLPEVAVVTSLEFDHGDIYRDIEEIELAFQRMLRQIPSSGLLIACADDPRALALRDHAYCPVESYGFSDHADWRGDIQPGSDGLIDLTVHHENGVWGRFRVPMAGRHNLQNVLAAIAVAARFGANPRALADSLPAFKGVRRRMEVFHESKGVTFVDDFAHHPTAIRETIAAARMRWPERRLWVLFEPRSNTTVTNRFQSELCDAFSGADLVWLAPIHRADAIPADQRLDRDALVSSLNALGCDAHAAASVDEIVDAVVRSVRESDVVLILSNGAFGGIYQRLREGA